MVWGAMQARQPALKADHDNSPVAEKKRFGIVRPASEEYVLDAVENLRAGNVIAVPTDTIYGFACNVRASEAIRHIYEIKGRVNTKPLAICVGDVSEIKRFVVTNYLPHGLLDSLFPGPVTVVLKREEASESEKFLNPGADSLGVRIPDSNFIREIARGLGTAIALTSANLSGRPSSICIEEFEDLWVRCKNVYDGGILSSGRAGSTVIDLTLPGAYKILRPGSAKDETVRILQNFALLEADGT